MRRRGVLVALALVASLLWLGPAPAARAADHSVFAYGDAAFHGSTGNAGLNQPIVGMARTKTGDGYWLVSREGRVFSFGNAVHHGSLPAMPPSPVIGIAATPNGDGYWLATANGSIYTFGAAPFLGGLGHLRLAKPIVGIAALPNGIGYWMVAEDGGIFAFGGAQFFGSTGAMRLNQPIAGMAAAPGGNGYWLVARDGGIFTFGVAAFHGSTGNIQLNRSIVGMAATPSGAGYWLVAADGGLFTFGDARFLGSLGGGGLTEPAVGVVGSPSGRGYWLVTTGHLAPLPTSNPPQVRVFSGTYRVTPDGPVVPGTYRAERAPGSGGLCHWERLDESGVVLATRRSNDREVITVREGDFYFRSSGCAPFVNDIFPITRSLTASFGDGTWVVGIDVGAGRWQASPGGSDCRWARVSDFSGDTASLKATDSGTVNPVVQIDPSDAGFVTDGCGTWVRQ
ncbi:MAG TPA: hypothetical protein VM262_08880 [Acidimicrobiales bacterium]|nr:hypothetical protein [Acidimicrobiales bacterium]